MIEISSTLHRIAVGNITADLETACSHMSVADRYLVSRFPIASGLRK